MKGPGGTTPAEERADYIRGCCADRGIVIAPAFLGHAGTHCAEASRGGTVYHTCGDGPDGYDAMGNMLALLADLTRAQ